MSQPPRLRPDTVAVHGRTRDLDPSAPRPSQKPCDAVPTPIVLSATFGFRDSQEICDHFEGRSHRDEYGRYGNPTVRSAESALAALERTEDAALFSSGMAAITTTLFALLKSGDHVVLTSDCYRRTRQFLANTLSRFGVASTLVAPGDLDALAKAIVPGKTRVILTEAPSNPYLRVADLPAVRAIAKEHRGLKVVVDSTFATPINLRPRSLGADLVVHSATKYLGGHNDLLAGAVAGDGELVSLVREMRSVLGGVLDAHAAYLLERGMKTLALRVARQNASAARIAKHLEGHPSVERVWYPALASHPDHEVAARSLSGFGGVVTFLVKGGLEGAKRCVDGTRLATIAPSLGGVETLIEQPALMSYYELTSEEREAIGVPDALVRLSVGIEDVEDLVADLDQALASVAGARVLEK